MVLARFAGICDNVSDFTTTKEVFNVIDYHVGSRTDGLRILTQEIPLYHIFRLKYNFFVCFISPSCITYTTYECKPGLTVVSIYVSTKMKIKPSRATVS